jgi:hypothetical protein
VKRRLAIYLALSLANLSGLGQGIQKAVPIKILVQDSSGAVIPNAIVKVSAAEASLTGANGETFLHLPPGEYDLVAISQGFSTSKRHVSVSTADGQAVGFSLQVASGGGPTVVALDDPNSKLQTSSNAVTAGVGADHTLALKINGEAHPLTPSDLAAFAQKTITAHNGHTNTDETYSGVLLTDLMAKFGGPTGKNLHGMALSDYILAIGADGYKAVLSLAETDPSFHPGDVIVADSMGGKALDVKEGPFKLVVTEDKRPARSVRNLVSIEVRTAE